MVVFGGGERRGGRSVEERKGQGCRITSCWTGIRNGCCVGVSGMVGTKIDHRVDRSGSVNAYGDFIVGMN